MKRSVLRALGRVLRVAVPSDLTPKRMKLADAPMRPDPIPAAQILSGTPEASSTPLVSSSDDGFTSAMWSCTPGRFRWFYNSDEIVHIMEGHVNITPDDGSAPFETVGGEVVFFARGSSAVWEITKTIRKVALFRTDPPDALGRLRGALTRPQVVTKDDLK